MILREVFIYVLCKIMPTLTNKERSYISDWARIDYEK